MPEKKICIADIVVALSGAFGQEGAFPPNYASFSTTREADLRLRVSWDRFSSSSAGRLVFSSGSTWRLTEGKDRFCLELFSEDFGSAPYRRCVFDRGMTRGEICLNPEARALRLIDVPFEYPLDEILYILLLSWKNGFLMHASGIVDKHSGGCLFCGHSGAGKSTMVKVWRSAGKGILLNDDRVVVRKSGEEFFIFGTPWSGEIAACRTDGFPLKKVFFLEKAPRHRVRKMTSDEAVARSLATSFLPFWDQEAMSRILDTMRDLVRRVDFFELEFLPDAGVLDVIEASV